MYCSVSCEQQETIPASCFVLFYGAATAVCACECNICVCECECLREIVGQKAREFFSGERTSKSKQGENKRQMRCMECLLHREAGCLSLVSPCGSRWRGRCPASGHTHTHHHQRVWKWVTSNPPSLSLLPLVPLPPSCLFIKLLFIKLIFHQKGGVVMWYILYTGCQWELLPITFHISIFGISISNVCRIISHYHW